MNEAKKPELYDVIIIGQGYAGLTAAGLAAQRGLRTLSLEGECMGGLIVNINELEPAPPGDDHAGFEVASSIGMRNLETGVKSVSSKVTSVHRGEDGLWIVETASTAYVSPHVIVASGARLRKLGLPNELEYFGRGVSECADCDGPMFKGMGTAVIGGGDSAFQEALALAHYATRVTVVMRSGPTARQDFLDRAAADPKILQLTDSSLVSIDGSPTNGVESIDIETAGQGRWTLPCSGVFIFIGLEPITHFLPESIERDSSRALVTSETCATALTGLWAIGAVRSGFPGMLTDAAADAAKAVEAIAATRL